MRRFMVLVHPGTANYRCGVVRNDGKGERSA